MRAPGDILLVACYELGHQPWNLASPLARLRRAGFSPVAVDSSVQPLTDEQIGRARLVAISVPMHTALRLGVLVAERVRRVNPAAHITFYGLYASLNQGYLLPEKGDTIIVGEYEAPLVELATALEGGVPVHEIPGVGDPSHPARPRLERLDFDVPRRDSLPPLERYAHFRGEGGVELAGYVETSRGCLHTCLHCPITPVYQGRFFVIPREVVLADIRAQVTAGARHVTFGDPDFLNGPGHVMRILRAMHEEFPDLTFDATIKIEHILEHEALFPELRRLGCAFIVSAIEAFSDHVLRHLDKGHDEADIARAIEITRAAGIPLRPSFVAFTPWTRMEDYLHLLHSVERYGMIGQVDPVQYAIRLLIPPGSALLDVPETASWIGELDPAAFTYRWAHPDPRMDELYRAVSALVEEAASREVPARESFFRVKELAYRFAGLEPERERPPELVPEVVPGLTEAWFC